MKITLRLTHLLLDLIRCDLARPHSFAHERVGFMSCRYAAQARGDLLVLGHTYAGVDDDDYLPSERFGALISGNAFRKAMQRAFVERVGLLHVHLHPQHGEPAPSPPDVRESRKFVPDFFHVRPELPHGTLILSRDAMSGRLWMPGAKRARAIRHFTVVGMPLNQIESDT